VCWYWLLEARHQSRARPGGVRQTVLTEEAVGQVRRSRSYASMNSVSTGKGNILHTSGDL
jgi:hypothetical protein